MPSVHTHPPTKCTCRACASSTSCDTRFPTFCKLAGVDPGNVPPRAPLPIDPADPHKDIWGNDSWPTLDGIDVWPLLMGSDGVPPTDNMTAAHHSLVISREVVFVGRYKLLVAQRGNTGQGHDKFEQDWQHENGSWFVPAGYTSTCGTVVPSHTPSWDPRNAPAKPCLFDIMADKNETVDLSADPAHADTLSSMWKLLNDSWLTYYHARSPAAMMGPCVPACAQRKWKHENPKNRGGPVCGVPGCDAPSPAPPSPAPPSSECNFTQDMGLGGHAVGTVIQVSSKEECCGLCRQTHACVAADVHPGAQAPQPSGPLYCHMKSCAPETCGRPGHKSSIACTPL